MKKERRSRSHENSENGEVSPRGSPSRVHYYGGSDSSLDQSPRGRNNAPQGDRARIAAADKRRTQSERRASSRQGHAPGRRPMNPHVRATRETVNQVRRQVKAFTRDHLGPRSRVDFPACTKRLEDEILPGWGMSSGAEGEKEERAGTAGSVRDYEDFLHLTLRRETEEFVMRSDEYIDLISIAKRASEFDSVVPNCRRRLQACLEQHARPHLVSLKHLLSISHPSSSSSPPSSSSQASSSDNLASDNALASVEEYDSVASQQTAAVEEKLKDLTNSYKSYRQMVRPFTAFVRSGDSHTAQMNACCTGLLEMCKTLEAWAAQDDAYPERLVQEMEEKKRLREKLQGRLRQTKSDKLEKKEQITRLKRREAKAARLYSQYRSSRDRLKDRLGELREKDIMVQERLHTKRDELKTLKESKEEASEMTPRRSQALSESHAKLEAAIEKLESEKRTTRKHIRRVEEDVRPANDKAYENKVEMVTFRHQREETEKECQLLDGEAVSIRERMARLDELCEKLVLVRELKISPEAYRKGLRELRRQEASMADGTHYLSDACLQAAPALGKKWRKLYFYLPFDPPRDVDKRQRDVILLDTLASRKDLTDKEVATKSLDKWRTFHRRGGVLDLSHALRAIHKHSLARHIETKYSKQVSKSL